MKLKAISVLLFFLMLVSLVPMSVSAAQEPAFLFDLSVNSETSVEADAGDVLLITLMLKRTDSGDVYTMHGMQSEISYDSRQFELVENSIQLGTGVKSTVVNQVDNSKEIYLNYLSLSGGEQWDAETFIGSFQLKVLTATGVGEITNHDYMVSRPDGSGSYVCKGNTVSVVLSTDCTVQFSPNGGTAVPEQHVFFGEKIQKPEDPSRDGYQFVGWYSDIHLQNPWDFENDTVSKSMTLYAKWAEGTAEEPAEPTAELEKDLMLPVLLAVIAVCLISIVIIVWFLLRKKKAKKVKKGRYAR